MNTNTLTCFQYRLALPNNGNATVRVEQKVNGVYQYLTAQQTQTTSGLYEIFLPMTACYAYRKSSLPFGSSPNQGDIRISVSGTSGFALQQISLERDNVDTLVNTYLVSRDYRYGFNGMEKDDEVAGNGNNYTAEFWQYDSRLGRRWNIDPVVKHHESPYAAFANNPIWFIDPSGADTTFFQKDGSYDSQAKKDFDDTYSTIKNKINEFELAINEAKEVLIQKLEGLKNARREMREYTQLTIAQNNWKRLERDFDLIIASDVCVVYSSLRGNIEKRYDGLTYVPSDGFNTETGKIVKIHVFVAAGRKDIVVHENRHVGQRLIDFKLSKIERERESFLYQNIFDPKAINNFIQQMYYEEYNNKSIGDPYKSLDNYKFEDALRFYTK